MKLRIRRTLWEKWRNRSKKSNLVFLRPKDLLKALSMRRQRHINQVNLLPGNSLLLLLLFKVESDLLQQLNPSLLLPNPRLSRFKLPPSIATTMISMKSYLKNLSSVMKMTLKKSISEDRRKPNLLPRLYSKPKRSNWPPKLVEPSSDLKLLNPSQCQLIKNNNLGSPPQPIVDRQVMNRRTTASQGQWMCRLMTYQVNCRRTRSLWCWRNLN